MIVEDKIDNSYSSAYEYPVTRATMLVLHCFMIM